jgi:hypothetical protein
MWQTMCHLSAQIPIITIVAKKSSLRVFLPKKPVFNPFQPQNTLQTSLEHQETNLSTL